MITTRILRPNSCCINRVLLYKNYYPKHEINGEKRGQGQYLAILTEQAWLMKDDDDDDVAKGKRFLMEKSRKSQAGNLVDQKTGFFF